MVSLHRWHICVYITNICTYTHGIIFLGFIYFFILCRWGFCLHVCMSSIVCAKEGVGPTGTEDMESCETYVLGIEPRSSSRVVSVINHWAKQNVTQHSSNNVVLGFKCSM